MVGGSNKGKGHRELRHCSLLVGGCGWYSNGRARGVAEAPTTGDFEARRGGHSIAR
jgi:hypothetical protein